MKIVSLLCCLYLFTITLPAQIFQDIKVQRLKKQLHFSKGDERLDCLSNIAWFYFASANVQSDSSLMYAKQAARYALYSTDKRRSFIAFDIYAKILLQFAKADEGLRYYRLALQIARQLKNDTLKAIAYRGVGQSFWYQGNFQKSVDTIQRAIYYFKKLGDTREVSDAKMVISNIYGDQGNYEKAFEASLEALRLSETLGDEDNIVLSLAQLGELYKNIGDYETALDYYHKAFSYEPDKQGWSFRHLSNCTGDLYCTLQKYDSAYSFYRSGLAGHPASKTSRLRLAEYYLLRKNYDTSLLYFEGLYNELKNSGEGNISIYATLGLGKIFYARSNFVQALNFSTQALQSGKQKETKQIIRDASKLLSSIHEELKQSDSALFYYKQYVQVKDSIVTDQFKGKLYTFRRTSEDQKKIEQIKYLKKQKLSDNRLTRILIGVIVLLCFLTLIIFRNSKLKRRNQKLQTQRMEAEWQRRAGELEMQALRAQMNPHFIFNCLSSINKFILKNEPDNASDYLTRFSRLIRLVLVNSQKPLVVLEDEIEMLRLYIEMEKLRFKNSFGYTIHYTPEIDPAYIFIPPLLLQPFCENAIWHGLMHKEGFGELSIFFDLHDNMMVCTITDNGIGKAKAAEIKSKSAERMKSLGLKITAERLALFNESNSAQAFYEMEDVVENGTVAGTCVKVNIKYKQGIEEPAEKLSHD